MDNSLAAISSASHLEDLWIWRGQVQAKPTEAVTRKIVDLWERLCDWFSCFPIRKSLEGRVVDLLYQKSLTEEGLSDVLLQKIQSFGLQSALTLKSSPKLATQTMLMAAGSLEDLWLVDGKVQLRPVHSLVRKVSTIWESVKDHTFGYSTKQTLANRVVDLFYEIDQDPANKNALLHNTILSKLDGWGLKTQFELVCEVEEHLKSSQWQSEDTWHRLYRQADLAWLRKEFESAGGATGATYYLYSRNKESKIGVFKATVGQRSLGKRIELLIKSFFGQRSFLNSDPTAEAQAEAAARVADQCLSGRLKNLIPFSRSVHYNDTKPNMPKHLPDGNLQMYIDEKSTEEEKKLWLDKESYTTSEQSCFQRFALFDYAILGNLDRHKDNWFIKLNMEGELDQIIAIDNANTFPHKNPRRGGLFTPSHQYAWASEKIASAPLTSSIKKWVKEWFTEEKVDALIECIKQAPDCQDFLKEPMEKQLKRRVEVLTTLVDQENFTPSELLKYQYEDEVEELLGPLQ